MIINIKHIPNQMTVKSLRNYLNEWENTYTEEDKIYLGEFEDTPILVEAHDNKGITNIEIQNNPTLGFVILPLIGE